MAELAAETGALQAVYAALNRGDIPAMVKDFDPQMEWIEFVESPGGGTYRGLHAVESHFAEARSRWVEGTCEPERFIVKGDKIIAFINVHVMLKGETEWREGALADVYTFRGGKAIQGRVFAERRDALAWVGVEAPASG